MLGKTLGHYRIVEPLGAGGMGEVYRARDTKLDRDVALKVLPERVAADHELLARFQREAKLLASLSHANIAAIYGLENVTEQQFIVMEVVEGETLEERIARSGPLDVEEALDIARQIASGLEAAHEKGVIHRDLKPANSKVTADGGVKILDFGLAKGFEVAGAEPGGGDASNSPTMLAATGAGIIMGTAAYMSPEQAKGMAVDKRSDIWSFGVVLYEMLSGRRLFEGETVSDVLADVLRADIDMGTLPPRVPRRARQLLARCLDRNPRSRLRDIGEARLVLTGPSADDPAPETPRPAAPRPLAWAAAVAAAAALVAITAVVTRSLQPAPERRVDRILDIAIDAAPAPGTALSPDGTRLAYWRRSTDLVVHDLVTGATGTVFSREDPTGGYGAPYWSPDGEELVFLAGGEALVMMASGGAVRVAAELGRGGRGRARLVGWGPDGILLSTAQGIEAVSSSGGERRLIIPSPAEQAAVSVPAFLADGAAVFVATAPEEEPGLYVRSGGETRLLRTLDNDLGTISRLLYGGVDWLVLEVLESGQREERGLWALSFDPERLVSNGEPRPLIPGGGSATMSAEGALVYADYDVFQSEYDIVWVGRDGDVQGMVRPSADKRPWGAPVVSPDGERMGVMVTDPDNGDSIELLVYEFSALGAPSLLTAGPGIDSIAGWLRDSEHLVVTLEDDEGAVRIVGLPLQGGGEPLQIATTEPFRRQRRGTAAISRPIMSPGGDRLTYVDADGAARVVAIDARGVTGEPQPIADGRLGVGVNPSISPDGKLAAVLSGGALGASLALTRLPEGMPTYPIGANVRSLRWSRDGRELFLQQRSSASGGAMMSVTIDVESGRPTGAPVELFSTTRAAGQFLLSGFDVAPDASRFLMVLLRQPPTRHVLIENFDAFAAARAR